MLRAPVPAALTCVAVAAALLVAAAPPAAAQPTVSVSATSVGEDRDFATESFGDPWDFANPEDHPVAPGARSVDLTNKSMSDGVLRYDSAAGGKLMLLDSWLGEALPWGRDGALHPIDANRYRYLSFRMRTTLTQPGHGQIVWLSCGKLIGSCLGGTSVMLQPGWHTYHVRLDTAPRFGPVPWSGIQRGLLLQSDVATNISLDWVRLHTSPNDVTITVNNPTPGSPVVVGWDTDTSLANNTPTAGGWGRLPAPVNGRTTMSTGGFPAGTYHLTVTQGGVTTYTGQTITIDARPAPVVISPSRAGGADYATEVRGDPWDFQQPSDVGVVRNATVSFSGGHLIGSNAGPVLSDPYLFLTLGAPIDAERWHRLTMDIWYEGAFSLSAAPGGGMNARLLWRHADTGQYSTSDDIVVYPGWNSITVDLKTTPRSAVTEGGTGRGWTGMIDALRIDPHEDSGIRAFRIANVRLAEDASAPGSYDIRFRDGNWEPGTTATIHVDTDNAGFDGTPVGTMNVGPGVNVFRWVPGPEHRGTRWVHVTLRDPRGQTSSAYATGPLRVTEAPGTPFGNVDAVTAGPASITTTGWTIDPDAGGPIWTHIYVNGAFATAARADRPRPDVGAAHPTFGPNRGFAATFPATPGTHTVCVHAINANAGTNRLLGCRTVGVPPG